MAFVSPAVTFADGAVTFLDQTLLPLEERHETTCDYRRIIDAIKTLEIRGAPLIGVAGAYAVVLAAQEFAADASRPFDAQFQRACGEIAAARPTAVNLSWAVKHMARVAQNLAPSD